MQCWQPLGACVVVALAAACEPSTSIADDPGCAADCNEIGACVDLPGAVTRGIICQTVTACAARAGAEGDLDCRASRACPYAGRCFSVGHLCQAVKSADGLAACRSSETCRIYGNCTPTDIDGLCGSDQTTTHRTGCGVGSDADCEQSWHCPVVGNCGRMVLPNGDAYCGPTQQKHCAQSQICRNQGKKCLLQGYKCV